MKERKKGQKKTTIAFRQLSYSFIPLSNFLHLLANNVLQAVGAHRTCHEEPLMWPSVGFPHSPSTELQCGKFFDWEEPKLLLKTHISDASGEMMWMILSPPPLQPGGSGTAAEKEGPYPT